MTCAISRGVTGCGEAKTSASSTARTSPGGRMGSWLSSNGPPSGGGRSRDGGPRLRSHRPEDSDGAEESPLVDPDPLQADELEQGEEGQDQARLGLFGREQVGELQRLALPQPDEQLVHALLDALALVLHLVGQERLAPLEQLPEGADEVVEAGLDHLLARV